jgi:hypothetical protein
MKTHLVYIIYIISILCASGWYIQEQKDKISEQQSTIQELSTSQSPPIEPKERKVKVVEKIVTKNVDIKGDCDLQDKEVEKLRGLALQCAYSLKFCQESSDIYSKMSPKEGDGNGKQQTKD